ncbi:mucin-5AC-like isoform X2 [Hermetia illucens]|uniref:mucin-5AC-like isoform X2 n=1 Tax=Hermetia illucens TaxID=343691 RepID=UPI0018CC07F6|nr:mucin-5AC-like isoform X2 [Hermetia illucens]
MEIKVVGGPCGFHGPYTFYKGLEIVPQAFNGVNGTHFRHHNSINGSNAHLTANYAGNKTKPVTRKCSNDRRTDTASNDSNNTRLKKPLVLALGDCIPVKPWSDSSIACIAEIRMIWRDKNEPSLLTGLRLYFLPENTPMGRNCHGEDEVVAISDKVVIRAEDLLNWIDEKLQWNWGLVKTPSSKASSDSTTQMTASKSRNHTISSRSSTGSTFDEAKSPTVTTSVSLRNSQLDFSDVEREKHLESNMTTRVAVLSYPRYCRYRATLKRLENVGDEWFRNSVVAALCGFSSIRPDMRVMFCRDTFDYPELETHELLCNHLAPKLKGRPRGRKKKYRSESPFSTGKRNDSESESNDSDISIFSVGKNVSIKVEPRPHLRFNHRPARTKTKSETEGKSFNKKDLDEDSKSYKPSRLHGRGDVIVGRKASSIEKTKKFLKTPAGASAKVVSGAKPTATVTSRSPSVPPTTLSEEKFFLRKLHEFHIKHGNVIPKMLWLNLKGVYLYAIFRQVKKLGGYDAVTMKKQWKTLFGENNEAHLSITRRKYEKILLPLERSELVTKKSSSSAPAKTEKSEVKKELKESEDSKEVKGDEDPAERIPSPDAEESQSAPKVPSLKVTIKKEKRSDSESELSKEEMTAIQNKVKSKISPPASLASAGSEDADIKPALPQISASTSASSSSSSEKMSLANSSSISVDPITAPISVPVTVIVESPESSRKRSTSSSDEDVKSVISTIPVGLSPETSAGDSKSKKSRSSQKIQIQQPHTTITVHQTTIHPQTHSKGSTSNQIQITNQIQIQQFTVQPSTSDSPTSVPKSSEICCNIKHELDGIQEVKIENRDGGSGSSTIKEEKLKATTPATALRTTVRVKNELNPFEKENIPYIGAGTTITPVISQSRKSSEVIDLADSDGESSSSFSAKRKTSSSQDSSSVPPVKKRKLDILREGGLEVTAISNTHGILSTSTSMLPDISLRIPAQTSVKPVEERFNLPSATRAIPTPNGVRGSLPKVTTPSMYSKTGKIFGNPKDILPPTTPAPSGTDQILDLTVKSPLKFPALEIHPIPSARRNRSPPTGFAASSSSASAAAMNLSNSSKSKLAENGLLITLVPQQSPSSSSSTSIPIQHPTVPLTHTQSIHNSQNHNINKRKSAVDVIQVPTPPTPNLGRVPHTSTSRSKSERKSKVTPSAPLFPTKSTMPAPTAFPNAKVPPFPFPPFLPQSGATAPNSAMPIFPLLLSNIYGQTPNMFLPNQMSPEFLQLYKNLSAMMAGSGAGTGASAAPVSKS